jgi:hypothetical protein
MTRKWSCERRGRADVADPLNLVRNPRRAWTHPTVSLGICTVWAVMRPDLRDEVSVRECSSSSGGLRITRVSPCIARRFKPCATLMFVGLLLAAIVGRCWQFGGISGARGISDISNPLSPAVPWAPFRRESWLI